MRAVSLLFRLTILLAGLAAGALRAAAGSPEPSSGKVQMGFDVDAAGKASSFVVLMASDLRYVGPATQAIQAKTFPDAARGKKISLTIEFTCTPSAATAAPTPEVTIQLEFRVSRKLKAEKLKVVDYQGPAEKRKEFEQTALKKMKEMTFEEKLAGQTMRMPIHFARSGMPDLQLPELPAATVSVAK